MNPTCCAIVSILAAILLLSAMACGASDFTESDATEMDGTPRGEVAPAKATRGEVLQSLTARGILPGYSAAAARLTQLELSVGSLCSNPGEDALTSAREGWRDAHKAWLRTESFRFGPAMERRSLSLLDWWPIDTVKIDRNLASQEAITEERVSEFLSATQRGLATAEYLLFGQGSDSLTGGPGGWERCLTSNQWLVLPAERLAESWPIGGARMASADTPATSTGPDPLPCLTASRG